MRWKKLTPDVSALCDTAKIPHQVRAWLVFAANKMCTAIREQVSWREFQKVEIISFTGSTTLAVRRVI